MNLKTNTWYVKLWDYTYAEGLPDNLCPFFWKLVTAMLLFIPNVILRIPVVFMNTFMYSKYNQIEKGDPRTAIGIIIYAMIIVIIFYIFCLYNYILWLFQAYSYNSSAATYGGFLLFLTIGIIIARIWDKKDVTDKLKEKTSNNIIVNYIKAWYNNHCPRIKWD